MVALRLLAMLGMMVVLASVAPAQPAQSDRTATLDAIVTGPDGNVPASLTPADLSLKIGGRPQQIRSVERLTPADGKPRHILLVVDEATLYALEPVVKDAVSRLLTSLYSRDFVDFYSTRVNGTQTGPTTRREEISAAVDKMVTGPGVMWTCQRDMMRLIASAVGELTKGRSTSVVILSRGHSEGATAPGESGSPCTPRREDLQQLEEAVGTAQVNVHFFTVDENKRSWGFDTIAGNIGATSGLLTWSSRDGLARAIQTTATYYRIIFAWDAPTDRAQRVELRTTDKTLKIRTSSMLKPN